ncbi:transposase [Nocardia salmonicida]|uniref:transposase n=1 Tax=Nocardia salmonicida TaxID=53431 RepID=UPI003684DADC
MAQLGQRASGFGTGRELHLACEQGRKPLALVITAGQWGDSPQFATVLDAIGVPQFVTGQTRTRPDRVLADKAYSSRANRA